MAREPLANRLKELRKPLKSGPFSEMCRPPSIDGACEVGSFAPLEDFKDRAGSNPNPNRQTQRRRSPGPAKPSAGGPSNGIDLHRADTAGPRSNLPPSFREDRKPSEQALTLAGKVSQALGTTCDPRTRTAASPRDNLRPSNAHPRKTSEQPLTLAGKVPQALGTTCDPRTRTPASPRDNLRPSTTASVSVWRTGRCSNDAARWPLGHGPDPSGRRRGAMRTGCDARRRPWRHRRASP